MRRCAIAGLALVLGGLCLISVGRAQDEDWGGDFRPPRGRRMGARLMAMLENDRARTALGLTDDQTARLRQILVEIQKANVKTGAEIGVRRIELRELLRADQPDREVVMKKVQELSELRAQMMRRHVESLLAAKAVLTPEQQKKFRALVARRFGERMWRERPPERPFGPPRPGAEAAPAPPPRPDEPPVE